MLAVYGLHFAIFKALFGLGVLLAWIALFVSPYASNLAKNLSYGFAAYCLFHVTLVTTSIIGTLQGSAGMPLNLFDFETLANSMENRQFISYAFFSLAPPLAIFILATAHHRLAAR